MPRWSLHPVGGDHYLVVFATALVLAVLLWRIRPSAATTRPRRGRVLLALRGAVVVLVILAMLRPTLIYTDRNRQSASVLLLFDKSRSMSVRDELSGRTRWEALKQAVQHAAGPLADLAKEFDVKAYAFSAVPEPVELQGGEPVLGDQPDGPETAIGASLDDVLRENAGKRLLGVLLLSDGAQRAYPPRDVLPQTAAARMRHLGCPLYTFRFGQARGLGQAQDVAVTELVADQTVFVKNELNIAGQVRIDGYANRPIPVELAVETPAGKTEVLGQQEVRASGDGQLASLRFRYVPQEPGEYKLVLSVAGQPGELVTTNNQMSTFVHALKGGLNVLYLEGELRPDIKYLRRSLDASPDIHVDYQRFDPEQPASRPATRADWFKPGKYDVFMLGDVDASAFREGELAALRDRVAQGAGLIMLGGGRSFGPGGYAETPLADVLPVQMNRYERQQRDTLFPPDLHVMKPVRMRPTPLGQLHFSLRLAPTPQESAAKWAQLPPLDGANRLAEKPTARILAVTDEGLPLLVSHDFGEGRVMAFGADSTWRWWMRGFEQEHRRFWRQIVLWLARKDEASEGNVWIRLAQRRFAPGQRVELTVGAQSPTGEAIKDAVYQVEVEGPNGATQTLDVIRGDASAMASFRETQVPGDYTIRVAASQGGQLIGSTRARFTVFQQDLELDNAAAESGTLDNLAVMTGGESLAPEQLGSLLRRLAQNVQTLEVPIEAKETLWDKWPFFLILVSLLTAEWFLRKRWGWV